jgi:hypothetical protein
VKGLSKPCCEGDQEEERVDDEDCSATAGGPTIPFIDPSDFSDEKSSCSSDGDDDDDVGSSSSDSSSSDSDSDSDSGSGGSSSSSSFGKPHAYAPFPTLGHQHSGTVPACIRGMRDGALACIST